jgi:hypothetical protein
MSIRQFPMSNRRLASEPSNDGLSSHTPMMQQYQGDSA